jgi:hypothetical protein
MDWVILELLLVVIFGCFVEESMKHWGVVWYWPNSQRGEILLFLILTFIWLHKLYRVSISFIAFCHGDLKMLETSCFLCWFPIHFILVCLLTKLICLWIGQNTLYFLVPGTMESWISWLFVFTSKSVPWGVNLIFYKLC